MSRHALLAPSSAHRWLQCAASVPLEAICPDESSTFADEGTLAHLVAADALHAEAQASDYIGYCYTINEKEWVVTAEMAAHVQAYLSYVRRISGARFYEKSLSITALTGEPNAQGTADAIIINGAVLTVIDFKYGRRFVAAEHNPQLQLYALAALQEFGGSASCEEVRLCIFQPRIGNISEWVCTFSELQHFKQNVTQQAAYCLEAFHHYAAQNTLPARFFAPKETTCRWCKASATCPALIAKTLEMVTSGAVDPNTLLAPPRDNTVMQPVDITTLLHLYPSIGLLELFCKKVRVVVEAELAKDPARFGYTTGKASQGPRRWADIDAVTQLITAMRIPKKLVYEKTLISPTTAEKRFKEGRISKKSWKKLEANIIRNEGPLIYIPIAEPLPGVDVQHSAATAELEKMRGRLIAALSPKQPTAITYAEVKV